VFKATCVCVFVYVRVCSSPIEGNIIAAPSAFLPTSEVRVRCTLSSACPGRLLASFGSSLASDHMNCPNKAL